ncbi:MAG: hypothetical protein J0H18_01200 [Rhizobiales bacterium]|nr:hypothetical protein [Hyphomicrobiales bacterium]OJY07498.1 MAG: hypothetical protein BGP07_06390 [Rhizobiales bacterium 63-22]
MNRSALLARLKELQETPKFQKRDICTVSAFLPLPALAEHVRVCEEAAGVARSEQGREQGSEQGTAEPAASHGTAK